jgi:PD-(D/E)XK nuclease superfamily protein
MATRRLIPYSPAADPLEGPLAEVARVAGRSVVLLLPGRSERARARQSLARRLGGCDPRLATSFGGLARRILGTQAPRVATERERDAYLAQALSELPGQAQHLTLRYRGFRKGLLHVFRELETNGLSEQELAGHLERARLDPQRAGRLHSAYRGYRSRLHAGGKRAQDAKAPALVTEADLLHQAAEALGESDAPATSLPQLVIVAGFSDLSPRQLEFLDALAGATGIGEVQVHWATPPASGQPSSPGLAWPAQTAALLEQSFGFERAPSPSSAPERPEVLERLQAELFAPASPALGPGELGDPSALRIVRAASREDEVELALTQVRAFVLERAAGGWRDVLIVASDPERYRTLLTRVAAELSVPLRVEGRRALTSAASVRGALALLEASARFDLGPLLVAAASPALGLEVEEADRLARAARRRGLPVLGTAERWRSLARELGGPAGTFLLEAAELGLAIEETCEEELERIERASYEARGDFSQGSLTTRGATGEIHKVLRRLLRPARLKALGDRPDAAAIQRAAAEAAAQRELLKLLEDLDRLGAPLYSEGGAQSGGAALRPSEQLVARIAEEIRAARFEPRDTRREVVSVVDAQSARNRCADLVLILGLVEREFPRAPGEDQFLPEATRRALSGRKLNEASEGALRLPTAEDHAAKDRHLFYAAATRARRELWLLYPGFSSHGAPRPASRFLGEVEALLSPEAREAVTLKRSPGQLISDDPEHLLTWRALRRFAYRYMSAVARPSTGERSQLGVALFDRLLKDPYERARMALSLGKPDPRLRPRPAEALGRVYSSSELESYATCPYRHFVRYLVSARPVDDLAHSGLDALRRGRVVHDALERVYRDGVSPQAAFEREFARGVKDLDLGMEEDAFKRQALRAIEAFVGEDDPAFRSCGELDPWQFELPFGPETDAGPLRIQAPALGGAIALRGQIDRVDIKRGIPAPELSSRGAGGTAPVELTSEAQGPETPSSGETPPSAETGPGASVAKAARPSAGGGAAPEASREDARGPIPLQDRSPQPTRAAPAAGSGAPRDTSAMPAGFVTDYKLGGREVDNSYLDSMHKGNKLQIPLYLLALQRVFGVRPLGAAFAALGTRRRTGVVEPEVGARWEPRLDEQHVHLHKVALDRTLSRAEDHVRRIVTGIAQGLIEPSPEDAQDCLRCDAQDVCRVDRDRARRIARRGRALPILPPQAFLNRETPVPAT